MKGTAEAEDTTTNHDAFATFLEMSSDLSVRATYTSMWFTAKGLSKERLDIRKFKKSWLLDRIELSKGQKRRFLNSGPWD